MMADKVRVNVYLDKEVRIRALEKARKMGISFSAIANLALYEFIMQDSVIQLVDMCKRLLSEAESGSDSD